MAYRWLTDLSQQFLDRDYLLPGQTVDERVDIICNTAEKILAKPGFAARFKENIKKGWYSLSTPIWSNFGTNRGAGISCFGGVVGDSMESIAFSWAETCMMTKHGGGTSGYFGRLRPRGAPIKDNGESCGPIHFMSLFDSLINVVSQGRSRRGNYAAYLDIDHNDIHEFLAIRSEGNPIQDLSFGVCVPDYWMGSMIEGDTKKRSIWAKVLESRANTGYPYIFFTDNVNNNTVDCYKDKGMRITHSNLCCVTGDQRVVSSRGLLTVKELYEQGGNLDLFDNEEVVKSSEMRLISEEEDVFEITLTNGMTHRVTKCHKVKTDKGLVRTDELKIGDRVAIQTKKGIFGPKSMTDEAFLLGLYQADGTQHKDIIMLDVWENDFDLIPEIEERFSRVFNKYGCDQYSITNRHGKTSFYRKIEAPKFRDCVVKFSPVKKKRLTSNCLKKSLNFEKGYVPSWIWESDEETQWQYVKGLFCADGTVNITESKGNPLHLAICNINKHFLEELQILLANLGIRAAIYLMREEGQSLLPDGKGGNKYYNTQAAYRLVCGNKNSAITFEEKTNLLSRKGISLCKDKYRDNSKKYYKIKKIEHIGKQPVYCCEVYKDKHIWICNGIQTKNSEIQLPDNEEESFVCDLSSMNTVYYDEWKDTDALELLVYFLDAVMTEFIEKAKKIKFMDRAVLFAERHRALGIGWIGWHSLLQSKMIPFESMEAKLLNIEIIKNMKEKAYAASAKMAKEYGEPYYLKGYGRRHATLLAIAPTKSSSFILGQASESIQPELTNICIKDLQKGKYTIKNRYLEECLEKKGKNKQENWDSILKHGGSVQHLDFLSQHERDVFKTFSEISPMEVVIQAAQRQKYIDQGQSLNLMIHPSTPVKDVNALMIEGWRLGIKGFYYQISANAAQQFSRSILNCSSCEA